MDKRIMIILVVLMTMFLGFGLIIPVMPVLVQDVGAEEIHLGWLLAVYSAASFLVSPFWGSLSDRIGRRPVMMIGLIGFSLSFFLFGISSESLWLMYASRILGGLFSGAATTCAIAYIADITSEENRTKGMGLAGAAIGMGFIFGPALGGLLSYFSHVTPFFVASGLSLITLLFTYKYVSESLTPEVRKKQTTEKQSRWTAFKGALKYLYVIAFVVSFSLAGLESTLQFFETETIGVTSVQIGWMFAVVGVVGAIIQGGVVRRIKPGKEHRAIQIGLVTSAIGFFLIIFSSNMLTATIYLAIFAAGNSLIRPCVQSLITKKSTVGKGVASGLMSSMDSFGRILGPLMGTYLYQFDIRSPFIVGSALTFLAVFLVVSFTTADKTVAAQN